MPIIFRCQRCGKEKPYISDVLNYCQAISMFCSDCGKDMHGIFPSAIFDRVVAPGEYIDVDSTEIDFEKLLKTEES